MIKHMDTIYLFMLGAVGIYAIKSINDQPQSHMLEGFNENNNSTITTSALESLMGDITSFFKKGDVAYTINAGGNLTNYDKTTEAETDSNTILAVFNDLLIADNPAQLVSSAAQQQGIVELRQKLAQIYALVINYSIEQDDIIRQQYDRLETLNDMENLNASTIKDTTAAILEDGHNKRRLIKNNEYFLNRYRAINDIVRYLIVFIVILTIIQYLNIKGFFGEGIGNLIVSIYIGSCAFFLWFKYINILRRSPLDYDEILWDESRVDVKVK